VENNTSNIFEDNYKEKIVNGMKENLLLSIVSFLWNKIIESDSYLEQDRGKFEKAFIKAWKESVHEIMQNQLKQINEVLNDSNVDLLNLITGKKEIADVEDYQEIINKSISEVEDIFWKICAK
jgi:succinate dehydrogenase flavin-adding protein (antitoxin of CptAB toxin-antitoxin module)